ncbi:MAG: PLP-dependent cysteine synthase family protein [Pseudomonadota bacterium]
MNLPAPDLALLPNQHLARFRGIRGMVGNTPLLAIRLKVRGEPRVIYAKAEHLNLTGSIKDRMALYILERAYRQGRIKAGDLIAEATSGNTGISFAAIGRALGHDVEIYMPDWMSQERVSLIRSFGASIRPVSHAQGGFIGSIRLCEELQRTQRNVFLPCQFSNEANVAAHYNGTGPEIVAQLGAQGLSPEAFVAGVGTGGTVMGVGTYLKSMQTAIQVHPLEPAESPTLSTGCKLGKHRIQGVSDEFVPPIVHLDALDAIIAVADGDAILMAQKLAQQLGLGVGISSGANLIGALLAQDRLGPDAVAVTIFCDDNKKYLTTDLLRTEPIRSNYLTPEVELICYEALPRVNLTSPDDVA